MKIAFIGHRYLSLPQISPMLHSLYEEYGKDQIWITGGAMGLDSWAAKFAMDHGIELWLILPFPRGILSAKWQPLSQFRKILDDSWDYASKTSVISPTFALSAYSGQKYSHGGSLGHTGCVLQWFSGRHSELCEVRKVNRSFDKDVSLISFFLPLTASRKLGKEGLTFTGNESKQSRANLCSAKDFIKNGFLEFHPRSKATN